MSDGTRMPLYSLTGVRGVAALWVVLFHIQELSIYQDVSWLDLIPFAAGGFREVDLFFILSGFIMMHVHATDFCNFSIRRYVLFMSLRVIRIFRSMLQYCLSLLRPSGGFQDLLHGTEYITQSIRDFSRC